MSMPSTTISSSLLLPTDPTIALTDLATNLTSNILNSIVENVTTTSDYYSEYDSLPSLPPNGMTEEEFFASLPVFDMFPLSFPTNSHVVLYAMVRNCK
uniref:Uncharacterized protein n=1 Tax=Panagrolaimus superbus TaxID=310955 RepID=A0A914YJG3_9BILA